MQLRKQPSGEPAPVAVERQLTVVPVVAVAVVLVHAAGRKSFAGAG